MNSNSTDRYINYLVFSDVHLFHNRTKTHEIITHLNFFFEDFIGTKWVNLDFIIIAGDLFDQAIDLGATEVNLASFWLIKLMHFCAKHNISLYVMEGTPSHDSKQSRITELLEKGIPNLEFQYIKDITILRLQKLKLNILFVPDRIRSNERIVFEEVKDLMRNHNLSQVDITITHGMYRHLCDYAVNDDHLHYEKDYLDITKHFVSNGHVHTFTVYDRIITEGSFDRLAHGEENPKGAVHFHIYPDNPVLDRYEFVPNKHAKIYKAIKLRNNDIDKAFATIDQVTRNYPAGSYVELRIKRDHPFAYSFSEIKNKYPQFNLTKQLIEDTDKKSKEMVKLEKTSFKPIQITKSNITELILSTIDENYPLAELLDFKSELESLI